MMTEHPLKLARYDLDGLDPYHNLAVEETLTRGCPADTLRVVFYRNAPSVIVGRNQNPWLEADLREADRLGVAVARRASGGGTVVHDAGNLNYGFIIPRHLYAPPRFLHFVVEALGDLGVRAATCTRNSIWVGDKKVSGTAFLLTGRTALLHGCILVHSDLERLRRLLTPPPADRRTRAVGSVRAPVTRLCDGSPNLCPDDVREAIWAAAGRGLAGTSELERCPDAIPAAETAALDSRLRSWEWRFGRTPDFEHVLHLALGTVTLQVDGARIAAVQAAGRPELQAELQAVWSGCRYDGSVLVEALTAARETASGVRDELAAVLRDEIPTLRPGPSLAA